MKSDALGFSEAEKDETRTFYTIFVTTLGMNNHLLLSPRRKSRNP